MRARRSRVSRARSILGTVAAPVLAAACLAAGPFGTATGAEPPDCFTEVPAMDRAVDAAALIHPRTSADAQALRRELQAWMWGDPQRLWTTRPDAIHPENSPPVRGLTNQGAVEAWTFGLPFPWQETRTLLPGTFRSTAHLYRSRRPNGRLVLYHRGHQPGATDGLTEKVTDYLLGRGFDVMVFSMPLLGPNRGPVPVTGELHHHDAMAGIWEHRGTLLSLFLSPVLTAINQVESTGSHGDIIMIGTSGGGWATTLAAALDPRIRRSYSVAGSLPLHLRRGPCANLDRGDWEQWEPSLYHERAGYLDLYLLASQGPGRVHHQVLNQYDPCCFAGVRYTTYEAALRQAVESLEGGEYRVSLDTTHRRHTLSNWTLQAVIGRELLSEDADNDGRLDLEECPRRIQCPDADGDGIPDWRESSRMDLDGDGLVQSLDPDDDGDGHATAAECPRGPPCPDADGDGIPDALEPADRDEDGDGLADSADPDDDGDGLPTRRECPNLHAYCPQACGTEVSEHRWPGPVVDDGDAGFQARGGWTKLPSGYQGDRREARAGSPTATWRFQGLPPGRYRLQATAHPAPHRASRVPWSFLDAELVLATVRQDQRRADYIHTNALARWEDLHPSLLVLGGTLEARMEPRLQEDGAGTVAADALRLLPVGGPAPPPLRIPPGGVRRMRGPDGQARIRLAWEAPGLRLSVYSVPLGRVGEAVRGSEPYQPRACGLEESTTSFRDRPGSWAFLVYADNGDPETAMGCWGKGPHPCPRARTRPEVPCTAGLGDASPGSVQGPAMGR